MEAAIDRTHITARFLLWLYMEEPSDRDASLSRFRQKVLQNNKQALRCLDKREVTAAIQNDES